MLNKWLAGTSWQEQARELHASKGLGWREQGWAFLLAAAAIAIRAPDMLLNPQFYAEGGKWYAQAYNMGWAHTLLLPDGGYFQIFPRLVEGVCLLVPLRLAPLLMNLCGIAVQALPVPILLSSRCSRWGPLSVRLLMAGVYVALPNAGEIHVVLTNAQWHLALSACLLTLTNAPKGRWKAFDVAVLLLSGLTGPFCLVLFPLSVIFWWKRRRRWSQIVCAILAFTSMAEGLSLCLGGWQQRTPGALGATALLLAKILAGQVYAGALIGQNEFASRGSVPLIVVVCLTGTSILFGCLFRAAWEWRLFILFCAMLLAASLRRPLAIPLQSQWESLAVSSGGRYWFFPMLAVEWSLIWWATESGFRPCQLLAIIFLTVMIWGELRDWKYSPFFDEHFPHYVRQLEAAPPGFPLKIPICPDGWTIRLIKKR